MSTERPRHFIIVGTTNASTYLHDLTGNRRVWPVRTPAFDLAALAQDRDQLWAEAAAREAEGVSIRLDFALWPEAARQQEDRRIGDPWEDVVVEKIGDQTGKIPISEIWGLLDLDAGRRTQEQNKRLGAVMRRLNFERKKLRCGGPVVWCYVRGATAEEREIQIVM